MDHADRSLSAALRTDLLWAGQALKCQNQLTRSFARKKKFGTCALFSSSLWYLFPSGQPGFEYFFLASAFLT